MSTFELYFFTVALYFIVATVCLGVSFDNKHDDDGIRYLIIKALLWPVELIDLYKRGD